MAALLERRPLFTVLGSAVVGGDAHRRRLLCARALAWVIAPPLVAIGLLTSAFGTTIPPYDCVGDCNADGRVQIDELIAGVRIALDDAPLDGCSRFVCGDLGGQGVVITCLVEGVYNALNGCPGTNPLMTNCAGAPRYRPCMGPCGPPPCEHVIEGFCESDRCVTECAPCYTPTPVPSGVPTPTTTPVATPVCVGCTPGELCSILDKGMAYEGRCADDHVIIDGQCYNACIPQLPDPCTGDACSSYGDCLTLWDGSVEHGQCIRCVCVYEQPPTPTATATLHIP
jgi:hypothetical protein